MSDTTGRNVVDLAKKYASFRNPAYRFEASSRMIIPGAGAIDYLKIYYPYLDIDQIDSVFGNAIYPSRFYGGRAYDLEHSLTDRQIEELNEKGKGVTFTLTNHYFDDSVYRANRFFLERHHRPGNAIVCTNDELADRIHNDFPDYLVKASLIKHLNTVEKVSRALEHYDRVVIPMDKNDDDAFLESLPEKDRIVLFADATCAYNCPARTCYAAISQSNWGKEKTSACSKKWMPRHDEGLIFFDVDKLAGMGFHHFKLVPTNDTGPRTMLKAYVSRHQPSLPESLPAPSATIRSFPKCGRTWLRTLLANYFNHHFSLHVPVTLQTLFTIIPNDHADLLGREHYQFAHVEKMPFLLASHKVPDAAVEGDILLLRSIPDVVVSDYFQRQQLGTFKGDMATFIESEQGSLRHYCRYLNEWARDDKWRRMLSLTYEEMHHDTAESLARVLAHLHVRIDKDCVESAVADSAFAVMQRDELHSGHAGMPSSYGETERMKVRKGKVGGHLNYLSAEELSRLWAIVRGVLTPDAMAMLDSTGLSSDSREGVSCEA